MKRRGGGTVGEWYRKGGLTFSPLPFIPSPDPPDVGTYLYQEIAEFYSFIFILFNTLSFSIGFNFF